MRNCAFVTLISMTHASALYHDCLNRRMTIFGNEIKIGWGKPSLLDENIAAAAHQGVTRNIFLGFLEEAMLNEAVLREDFSRFGTVEHVRVVRERRIAFVHMTTIQAAMKAVMMLSADPAWAHRRMYYGRDRCSHVRSASVPSQDLTLGGATGDIKHHAQAGILHAPDSNSENTPRLDQNPLAKRTVYMGSIHADITTRELCDVIRGGLLQNIKYMHDRGIAFATFIEASAAESFYNRGVQEGMILKNKRVKFGWGKESSLPSVIATAVQLGASRNVYIGTIDKTVTEETLRRDFAQFGEIELINIVSDRNIGFVNFTDIVSAIKAVETMKTNPMYLRFKVNFGKDRCGNPPRTRSTTSNVSSSSLSTVTSSLNTPTSGSPPSSPSSNLILKHHRLNTGSSSSSVATLTAGSAASNTIVAGMIP
eukprot:jgi/Hompol1/2612/HPOL_006100-RA